MASLQEEYHHQVSEIVPTSRRHSNRIAALNLEDDLPPPCIDHDHKAEGDDMQFIQKPRWRNFVSYVGPGFVISMAYLDPSNLETDLQAGANHGYELLWIVLIGMIFAVIIQSLAANLGVSTGKHLSELCNAEYPKYVKLCLWLLAEMAVIAADIPEVIGTACALNILFHIPVWAGVLMTGFSTLLLLGIEKYGVRKIEMLITSLLFLMAACFIGELSYVKPSACGVVKGMFVPKLSGQEAIGDAIALIGAILTPHNLFLHSSLVLHRKIPNSVRGINDACRFYLIETGFALLVAFTINVSIVAVSSTICTADDLSPENADRCNNLSLNSASFLLKNVLGKSSSTVYAIALLASGQSSAISGTYAGQYIMQGFLDLKMRNWVRNLMTRCIAITPSLIVSIIGGASAGGRLIIIANMILSFELPFVLIPLLKFSNSSTKMGPHKNSFYVVFISWILGLLIIGINLYYLSTGFVHWLTHNNLPKVGKFFIGIIVFPLMAIYILAIVYLTSRKDTTVTYIEPMKNDSNAEANMESGQGQANQEMALGQNQTK